MHIKPALLATRRSLRKYTAEPVPDEMIQELLTAGMSAPSGGNSRPWRFVVVTAREQLDALAVLKPVLGRAPLAIVVCGDRVSKHKEAWAINCSLASQNMPGAWALSGWAAIPYRIASHALSTYWACRARDTAQHDRHWPPGRGQRHSRPLRCITGTLRQMVDGPHVENGEQ
jgi:nitroreductase